MDHLRRTPGGIECTIIPVELGRHYDRLNHRIEEWQSESNSAINIGGDLQNLLEMSAGRYLGI